jgi:Putative peptidoglycan binding domain/LysM domain
MSTLHVVQQGECLSSIARQYGFPDYTKVYNHPDNAEFKRARPDPNVIFPGDQLMIPDKVAKVLSCATGQSHRFVVKLPKRKLQLKLIDASGSPIANMPYTLLVGSLTLEGSTSGEGKIEHDIPIREQKAKLVMNGTVRTLFIGHLNPIKDTKDEGISGVQSRLKNLGYPVGAVDGKMSPSTRAAIQAFQSDHDMTVDGEVSDALIARLQKEYGA